MIKNIIPVLSSDVSFHPINKNDYFIYQSKYDHRIKISSEFHDFIKLIDDKKNLNEILSEYNMKYNSNLTFDFAYDFLYNKLAHYGIIVSETTAVIPSTKPSYLKLNFIVFNERIVSKITKHLHFLFAPKILLTILLLSLFILSFCFYEYNYEIFKKGISKTQWLYFFILSFIGVTFHEIGHASAAHHYGAKHGGIGGGFYLFMPVYFADVTDIWKLTKSQRITVNLAGMYFELIYVLLLILIGFIFALPYLVVFGCIIILSSLRNLNPFIRSDGYWVLSDATEKQNLMLHGFIAIKRLFLSRKNWLSINYFLLIYGLISYIFMLFFIYYVVIKNPDSILYFPQNLKHFIVNLFSQNFEFSLAELGKLLIPVLFFYLLHGFIKSLFSKIIAKK